MNKVLDLTGQKYGQLTVLERAENRNGRVHFKCICDCGNICVIMSKHLISGHTKSCGCLSRFKASVRKSIHKMTNTKIYGVWCGIKRRCFNSNCSQYHNYGGRGITIYPAWIDDFQSFYDYVSTLEHFNEQGYSIDRINVNGNYEPGNLRWADWKTQCRNTRRNRFVEYDGVKFLITHAAKRIGISAAALRQRIKKGDTGKRLFRPAESHGRSSKNLK